MCCGTSHPVDLRPVERVDRIGPDTGSNLEGHQLATDLRDEIDFTVLVLDIAAQHPCAAPAEEGFRHPFTRRPDVLSVVHESLITDSL